MKPTPELIELVNKTPDLDRHGKVHGAPWEEAVKIYDGILKLGRNGILQTAGMLKAIDDGADYKARYTLHGIVMYVGRPEKATERKMVADALASELGGDLPKSVQGFLIRQLQLAGSKENASAIGSQLLDDENWDYAAQALLAIEAGAVEPFRAALPKAQGKQRLTIVQALGVLRDSESAAAIRAYLGDADRDLRTTTAWALARMIDEASSRSLLELADRSQGWERTQVTDACFLLAENLSENGKRDSAAQIYLHLKSKRTEPAEAYIREAASEKK